MSSVIKQGWLEKKGGGNFRSNWNRRFFVLYGDRLEYYVDASLSCLKGSVSIDGTHIGFNVVPFPEKRLSFVMSLPNREFVMQASTEEEMNSWIAILLETHTKRKTEVEQDSSTSSVLSTSDSSSYPTPPSETSSPLPPSPSSFSPLLLPPTKSKPTPTSSPSSSPTPSPPSYSPSPSPSSSSSSSPRRHIPPFSLSSPPPSPHGSPQSPISGSPNRNNSSPVRRMRAASARRGSAGRIMDEGVPVQRRYSVPKVYSFSSIPVSQWSVQQVGEWLTAIGAKTAVASFAQKKVAGSDLFNLSGDDIRDELEVEDIRIESAILKGIGLLKKGNLVPTKLFVEKNEQVDEPSGDGEELPDGWGEYVDPKGRKYYYNKQTRQKQWNKPAASSATSQSKSRNPLFLWGTGEVAQFLEDNHFPTEFIDSVKKAGWTGPQFAGATKNDICELGGEEVFEKFASEICNLLGKKGQKYMVLWSVEATQEERLSLAAGSTVYGVEGVDEEWIKVRDQKGGVGRVPFRHLRLVLEKSPTGGRPTRSLSRARRPAQSFSIKEKLKPQEWEGKDVEQWLKDIAIGEENIKLLEGVIGKELLQMNSEAFKQKGITQEIALTSLEKGIKQLLTGNVPRTSRQVKHYSNWSEKDVVGWLLEIGLGPMTQQAIEQGLKGEDLGKLNKEKVKELGGEDSSWVNIQKKLAKIDIEWGVKEKEEE